MGKLENMTDSINRYLRNKGLPRLQGEIPDIFALFELTLRSVWTLDNHDQRESMAVEIAQAIKPYFGGKKIEDALDEVTAKLNKEEKEKSAQSKVSAENDKLSELNERLKDPDYVPTFEELLKAKKGNKDA